ncbi:hypothetical protein [Mycoplasmopsis verecunda]|uniref:Glucose-6-phosphate isomerase n=1 Tax=Mycoplasmopsis verecunda TaxID=171291 RepID=A0A1T4L1R9_9BACT|nr:hypothetical protein [Mycoplasmopsis verecunda]WPB54378.1 hypothetical protein SAM46_02720 [Mycoplasmopsis verecunda]SJZ48655.1 glucose-6-phosphate isomerase [Mycoplasmopsis verecunda]
MNFSPLEININDLSSARKDKKFNLGLNKMQGIFQYLRSQNEDYDINIEQYINEYWAKNKRDFTTAVTYLKNNDVKKMIIIADGESYILTKAIYDVYYNKFSKQKPDIELIFTQGNINPEELVASLYSLKDEIFAINYISHSAISLESSIAFREYRKLLIDNLKKQNIESSKIADLIYITTDEFENTLNKMANFQKYTLFINSIHLPTRFSSLFEATSIFPLLASGINVMELLNSYLKMYEKITVTEEINNNAILMLAIYIHYIARVQNLNINYVLLGDEKLQSLGSYIQLLINTTLNKNQKGISCISELYDYSSLKNISNSNNNFIFSTFLGKKLEEQHTQLNMVSQQYDVLDFLGQKDLNKSNKDNETIREKDVFNIEILINDYSEVSLGSLIISLQVLVIAIAFLYDFDPFSQPGVEVYKRNLYNILLK